MRISKFKEDNARERVAAPEECERLFKACTQSKNPYLLTIIELAISTGMRKGEILSLQWENIDLERALIHLKNTKNGRRRSVPIVDVVLLKIKELFSKRNPYNPYVFPSKRRFSSISIQRAWENALARASIENLRFHDLRHTFATYAAQSGASHLELATAMGHRTLQMLLRYTHLDAHTTRKLSNHVSNELIGEHFEKK